MISLLKNKQKLTTFKFYSSFLKEVAVRIMEKNEVSLKFVEYGDDIIHETSYKIEPTCIPLLLSLFEQLSKFYGKPIDLELYNNHATKKVLKFLHKSDFFYLSGDNRNPNFPYGRNILKFNNIFLGDFIKKEPRPEHKVRCYSLTDNALKERLEFFKSDDEKRDFLISEFIYDVREHFQVLLFDNINTAEDTDFYIEILSELITNGVLHSKSNTFALMFVNKFSTKFSISDNGIGLQESLKTKKATHLYSPFELKNRLDKLDILKVNEEVVSNLNVIIETLFYSSLKDRRGLFDLMASVVLKSNGYFRLHTDNAQIIISNRMRKELIQLNQLRNELFEIHKTIVIQKINDSKYNDNLLKIKSDLLDNFIKFYQNICDKYNNDYQYSSIRFYSVRFRGVHIEVEIPRDQLW